MVFLVLNWFIYFGYVGVRKGGGSQINPSSPQTVKVRVTVVILGHVFCYSQTAEVTLEISSVTPSDAGHYICKVQIPSIPGSVFKDSILKVAGTVSFMNIFYKILRFHFKEKDFKEKEIKKTCDS